MPAQPGAYGDIDANGYADAPCRHTGRDAFDCSLRGRFAGRGTETVFSTVSGRVTSIAIHFA